MRFILALVLAFFATSALFFLMVQISKPTQAKILQTKSVTVDFGALPKETKVKPIKRPHPELEEPDLKSLPKTKISDTSSTDKPSKPTFDLPGLTGAEGFKPGLIGLNDGIGSQPGSSSGGSPQVMIQPQYPPKARQNKVEGYVTVEFSINELGRPFDISIVDAMPRGYFEKAAKRAVSRWKYAADSAGQGIHQVTLEFKLTDEAS